MSLTGTGTGCMTAECTQTGPLCNFRNQGAVICPQVSLQEDSHVDGCFDERELSSDRRRPSLSVKDQSYSASFHLLANEWLAFWLFLVSSTYFLLSKNVSFFCGCRIKPAEKVSSLDRERTIPNARTENDATAVNSTSSCSESCTKCDAYSEISDLDRASYWDSLLSLEEEDSEWLSDSKLPDGDRTIPNARTENDATAVNSMFSCSESCTKCDAYSEISELDRASYWDSLLSLEEEDSEWLSEWSSENPSTPLSYKCDSFSEISDLDTPGYWDSLLRLEGKGSEWISDSKQKLEYVRDGFPSPSYKGSWDIEVLPSVSTISSLTGGHCNKSEDNISVEHLLETANIEEFGADEPLFWPFEGKFNRNSEESCSSFSTSPRRRLVFDSRSTASRIKECKQKGVEAVCSVNSETSRSSMWSKSSAKIVTLECKDEKVVQKRGEVLSNKLLSLSKTFLNEDFASNKDLPLGREYFALDPELPIEALVGLKEFDGHEGLDSEFNGDVFMLDESLQ